MLKNKQENAVRKLFLLVLLALSMFSAFAAETDKVTLVVDVGSQNKVAFTSGEYTSTDNDPVPIGTYEEGTAAQYSSAEGVTVIYVSMKTNSTDPVKFSIRGSGFTRKQEDAFDTGAPIVALTVTVDGENQTFNVSASSFEANSSPVLEWTESKSQNGLRPLSYQMKLTAPLDTAYEGKYEAVLQLTAQPAEA